MKGWFVLVLLLLAGCGREERVYIHVSAPCAPTATPTPVWRKLPLLMEAL